MIRTKIKIPMRCLQFARKNTVDGDGHAEGVILRSVNNREIKL